MIYDKNSNLNLYTRIYFWESNISNLCLHKVVRLFRKREINYGSNDQVGKKKKSLLVVKKNLILKLTVPDPDEPLPKRKKVPAVDKD